VLTRILAAWEHHLVTSGRRPALSEFSTVGRMGALATIARRPSERAVLAGPPEAGTNPPKSSA